MSAKKQSSLVEIVRDAAIGYTVVVLSVVCFLLALAIAIAGVRIVTGGSLAATTAANAANQAGVAAAPSGSGTA